MESHPSSRGPPTLCREVLGSSVFGGMWRVEVGVLYLFLLLMIFRSKKKFGLFSDSIVNRPNLCGTILSLRVSKPWEVLWYVPFAFLPSLSKSMLLPLRKVTLPPPNPRTTSIPSSFSVLRSHSWLCSGDHMGCH